MYYRKYHSSYFSLVMVSDGEYLTGLYFDNFYDYRNHQEASLSVFDETKKWLDCYFEGDIPTFLPRIKLEGTAFQKEVWDILLTIPYGTTTTYSDIAFCIAQKRGIKKMSAQAIGQAVSKNPIVIIVPCHRVVGKNQTLTGYAYGLQNKEKLLHLEGLI